MLRRPGHRPRAARRPDAGAGRLRGSGGDQADHRLRDMPVIMMSSVEELDSVVKCIEIGAEDYLTKPINPVLLNARITASLEKKRLRDQQRELISKFATKEVAEDLLTSGFSLGGKHLDASAYVLRHPLVHDDRRGAGACRDDRVAERLLHADDGRHRRGRRHREPDGRRRSDGDLRRAVAARGPSPASRARGAPNGRLDPPVQREQAARTSCRSRSVSASRRGRWSRATRARTTGRPTRAWATPSTSPLVSSRIRRS